MNIGYNLTFLTKQIDLNDRDNFRGSKDLIEFARNSGLYPNSQLIDNGGKNFDISLAFSTTETLKDNFPRLGITLKRITPSLNYPLLEDDYVNRPVTFKSEKLIGVADLINLLKDHFEGTSVWNEKLNSPHLYNEDVFPKIKPSEESRENESKKEESSVGKELTTPVVIEKDTEYSICNKNATYGTVFIVDPPLKCSDGKIISTSRMLVAPLAPCTSVFVPFFVFQKEIQHNWNTLEFKNLEKDVVAKLILDTTQDKIRTIRRKIDSKCNLYGENIGFVKSQQDIYYSKMNPILQSTLSEVQGTVSLSSQEVEELFLYTSRSASDLANTYSESVLATLTHIPVPVVVL